MDLFAGWVEMGGVGRRYIVGNWQWMDIFYGWLGVSGDIF